MKNVARTQIVIAQQEDRSQIKDCAFVMLDIQLLE